MWQPVLCHVLLFKYYVLLLCVHARLPTCLMLLTPGSGVLLLLLCVHAPLATCR